MGQTLCLSGWNLKSEKLGDPLSKALEKLPAKTIKSINLSNNPKLDVSCLIELFNSQNTKLKSLNLSNTDICLLDLYLSMSKNPSCYLSLHELNVANCQLKKKSGL